MGVYFSEHPLSAVAAKAALEHTTLCGQIDAELVGQTVVAAGMVASVRSLFTKDRRPFVSAVLEDLDGRIETMVWPKLYSDTRDLWQEGNILLVEGEVKLRNDQVQLHCDRVRRYQIEATQGEEIVTAQPTKLPIVAVEAAADTAPVENHRLVISISQTNDKDTDIACLHKLIDTLKEFPGQDAVSLRVANEERITNLKLSSMSTGYCHELHQQLVELVGEDRIRVEPK
jgi:DNA polymerase-3 subunit alpha